MTPYPLLRRSENHRPEKKRVERLRARMKERRIKAVLVTGRENVRYLSGFTGSAGSLIVTDRRLVLVTDFRYQVQARMEAVGASLYIQKKDWASAITDAARHIGADRLWYNEASMTVDSAKRLRRAGLALKGTTDIIGDLRQYKDDVEIRCIRKAISRAEEAFRELRRYIRPGVSERDLGLRLEYLIRDKGSRRVAFDIIVASGMNSAMPHASVTERIIRNGDLVTIDFGAEADGYFCDITRTVCIGRPTRMQREIHEVVLKAQEAAINAIRPGIACRDLDSAARNIINKAGYGRRFGHSTGHGVGLMVHEGPAISQLSTANAAEGMVFTIEPGVYIPGWGGIRIEDMVLVTNKGVEVLTTLPRGL